MAQQPLVEQDLLVAEAALSHSETPHSLGITSTSDRLYSETSTWQQKKKHSQETDIHAAAGLEPSIAVSMRPLESATFYSDFIFLNRFSKTPQIKISWNLVQREPSCSTPTDGRTDITKIIVAFRDLQKAPNNLNEV